MDRPRSTIAPRSEAACCPPGLAYLESWVDERGLGLCFQLMETEEPGLFDEWIANWSDLVEFEIIPVIASGDAAARMNRGG